MDRGILNVSRAVSLQHPVLLRRKLPSFCSSQQPHATLPFGNLASSLRLMSSSQPDSQYTYNEKSLGQRLGQNFNSAGIELFWKLLWGDATLAMPHLDVPNIRSVNWKALKAAGFKGCVFDKDNTLTEPYCPVVAPLLQAAVQECQAVFGGKLVLYSNSAGLYQFDPQGKEAAEVEGQLGIAVLRHAQKKPAGGSAEMEEYFGCAAHELVMVGDRYFTDVVFGNRNGLLTIRCAPLTLKGEPLTVQLVRTVEERQLKSWKARGVQPPIHPLVPESSVLQQFVQQVGEPVLSPTATDPTG